MNKPIESMLELVGNTPMLKLKRIPKNVPAQIWAKLEFFNPSGSVKDRIALKMIEGAERRGDIKKGTTIIEPTSGNTGIGLSFVCALKGYPMIAVMPESSSEERIKMMELFGAKVELVKCKDKKRGVSKEDMECVVSTAEKLHKQIKNSFIPNQFTNDDNPKAHEITAKEILEQTNGKLGAFVAACGSGGTFTGVARVLKRKNPKVKRVVVEPKSSAVISGCKSGFHKIQGIGEGFIPYNMDCKLATDIIKIDEDDAIAAAQRLWREEGIVAGISSGANVLAAFEIGKKMKKGDIVVTIIADTGLRYFSTELFQNYKKLK
ncbi:MAG: cysteine synthase A [bacterium]|nr:cysteine synthase A [bacterium]